MELDEAVAQLYGLPPDAFLPARRELAQQAKAAKDVGLAKAIESVRKPTAAAWAVNQLVRARAADVERLLALAASLHHAQERMDGAALKTLGRERTTLVDELVRTTGQVAQKQGGAMSAPVAAQVRETFVAALASTAAAEAVGSGQLTRALSYAGFGEVDLSEATAAPAPNRRPVLRVIAGEGKSSGKSGDTKASKASRAQPEADAADVGEEAAEEEPEPAQPDPMLVERLRVAEKRSRETMSTAASAGDALTEASDALEALDARIAQLETSVKEAKAERPDLVAARNDAAAANKVAERSLRAALAEVDQIRQQLPDEPG